MEPKELEHFKQILTERLDELVSQAGMTVNKLLLQSEQEIDPLDRATAFAELAFSLKIRSRESRLIAKIRDALERIENGTYGMCESCGETISYKRLEARPVTAKCIQCKEKEEQLEMLTK